MRKILFLLFLISFQTVVFAKSITKIEGISSEYIGQSVAIYTIDDYLSNRKTKVATAVIKEDSTFSTSFYNEETRKIEIRIGKDYLNIYAAPNANYSLYIDGKSPYSSEDAPAIDLDFFFLDLDSTDINYRILLFDQEKYNFLEQYNNYESLNSIEFVSKLDTFKMEMTKRYQKTDDDFFKTYVLFSLASIDNLAFKGSRNEYEKYDFYIKPQTVWYQNDVYMNYIQHYYAKFEKQLSKQVNEQFYKGVIKESPTLIMKALGGDYTLKNIRLREVVMINMLSEIFFDDDYPQTNVLTVLDSVANHALFEANKKIAQNIKYRLLDLAPGTKLPDFYLTVNGKKKSGNDYLGKHFYIQFVRNDSRSLSDLKLVHPLHEKYGKHIRFLTVLVVNENDPLLKENNQFIKDNKIAWDFAVIEKNNNLIEKFNVSKYPYYMLIDASNHVVSAPSRSPRPDNEYNTIEKDFFKIDRYYRSLENR